MLGFQALGRRAIGQGSELSVYLLSCAAGSFTISGQAATLRTARTLSCAAGAFTVSGQEMTPRVTMPAGVGAFTLTGQAAVTLATRRMTAAAGSFSIASPTVVLKVSMPAGVGAYVITSVDNNLVQGYVLDAEPFVATESTFVGYAALGAVSIGQGSRPTGTTYAISGQDITPRVTMPAGVGAFVIAGSSVTNFNRTRPKIVAFPRVGRGTVSAKSTGRDIRARAYGG